MGETEPQLDISHHQMKLPVLIKFLAKGVHGNLQTTQAIVKAVGDLLQTESKVLLLKITPTQLIKNGAVKVVQSKSILP